MTEPAPAMPFSGTNHAARTALLQRLHAESDAQIFARALSQFHGSDAEFADLAGQYASLAPRLKGDFLERHGLSSDDSEVSQGTNLSLSVSAGMGQFLYNMVLAHRPARVLELGSSCGVSTIYLASALQRLGAGTLVATELDASKCAKIRQHVATAGIARFVDLREGDIFETVSGLDGVFDLVFIDVWATLYLQAFRQLERLLRPGSIVISDNMFTAATSVQDFKTYLDANPHVVSTTMDFESGVEFTVVA